MKKDSGKKTKAVTATLTAEWKGEKPEPQFKAVVQPLAGSMYSLVSAEMIGETNTKKFGKIPTIDFLGLRLGKAKDGEVTDILPLDEPVFIVRARDPLSLFVLLEYKKAVISLREAMLQRGIEMFGQHPIVMGVARGEEAFVTEEEKEQYALVKPFLDQIKSLTELDRSIQEVYVEFVTHQAKHGTRVPG